MDKMDSFGFHIKSDERFQEVQRLGKGAFGVIVSASDTEMQKKVAIKRLPRKTHTFSREFTALHRLKKAPYTVELLDFFLTTNESLPRGQFVENLEIEFCEASLLNVLNKLTTQQIKEISLQMFEALAYYRS